MYDAVTLICGGAGRMKNCKLLLFDLDGTLLRSDKTISENT